MGCGASASGESPPTEAAEDLPSPLTNSVEESKSNMVSPNLRRKPADRDRVSWRKGDLIGTGANGRVYLGLEEDTGAIIAVKEIVFSNALHDREELEQMQEEIELLRTLSHPNIVTYLGTDVNDDNQTLYIFTEWVPGGSIQALVTKFGRLPEVIVRKYVAQLLVGLAYLHHQQVVHRDIKAANILVDDRGMIKLADFGSSKRIDTMGTLGNECHSLRGTPYFMAPEVIMQTGHGRKADIWSVGCTILQMVTGQPPWKSLQLGTPAALMFHIANAKEPPPMPETLSKELKALLYRTFDRDVDRRPNAQDLLSDPFLTAAGAAADAMASALKVTQQMARDSAEALEAQQQQAAAEGVTVRLVAEGSSPRGAGPHYNHHNVATPNIAAERAADRTLAKKRSQPRMDNMEGFAMEKPPHDEAMITMFITKEALTQVKGADKHFPGRPLTARPKGAPPIPNRRDETHSPLAPRRTSARRENRPSINDSKSPLLMKDLPPKRTNRPPSHSAPSPSSRQRQRPEPPPPGPERQSASVVHRTKSNNNVLLTSSSSSISWEDSVERNDDVMMATTHDERPIVTEAARREQIAELEKERRKTKEKEERERKNEQFKAELNRFRTENRGDLL